MKLAVDLMLKEAPFAEAGTGFSFARELCGLSKLFLKSERRLHLASILKVTNWQLGQNLTSHVLFSWHDVDFLVMIYLFI